MSISFPPSNPTFPGSFPQAPSPSSPGCSPNCSPSRPPLNPSTSQTWNYGFKRLVPLLESPPVGAGILAITLFFLISFLSDFILAHITTLTLGIVVTLSTFGILALIILILVLL